MSERSAPVILALGSEVKGLPFLRECKHQGCHVILLTTERLKDGPWPWDSIDERFDMPDIWRQPDVTHGVCYLARSRRIDRITALDDYDVETAAELREHLQLDGLDISGARRFRDKLAMRTTARRNGLPVPEFVALFNDDEVRAFLERVPPPWVFKPRDLAGSEGIRTFDSAADVWRLLNELGDRRSYHLLEQFVTGDVFHVDGLVWDGEVVFSLASRYGTPPLTALQGRGVFTTRVLDQGGEEARALRELNVRVVTALGRRHGPTHSEFIRGRDGRFYFLEAAARVAGGNIEKVVEAATGLVIWQEAARIELADLRGEAYLPPGDLRHDFAGLIAAPAFRTQVDTSAYTEAEIVFRAPPGEFVSLVFASSQRERVEELLAEYARRFAQDFKP